MSRIASFAAVCFLAPVLPPPAAAQSPAPPVSLVFNPGSSVKLYQINGDCDWVQWDSTITNKPPTCKPTTSQTLTKADVLGSDVAISFEHDGELIMTFGDTIGGTPNPYFPTWATVQNNFNWAAHDAFARSTTKRAEDGLLLNYFLSGNHGLAVQPPAQPDGSPVEMAAFDVPDGGISLNGQIYLVVKTGTINNGGGDFDLSRNRSVLVKFNENTLTFTSGRTISKLPEGHFVHSAMYEAAAGQLGTPAPVLPDPAVVIFGLGDYRNSNIYLSVIPKSQFESGVDAVGKPATRYFSGLNKGQPTWSQNETDAVPVVADLDPDNPTIGDLSVYYSPPLGLWLMTYDGGRYSTAETGVYFAYAPQPWGPWSSPQLIFNACRDKGFGNFIYYYYATAARNDCPSAMPPGAVSAPNSAGPAGPTIGDQTMFNPRTTRGGPYAPYMVHRFITVTGNTLKIYYTVSTWNPYTAVLMESDFTIGHGPAVTKVANSAGESPIIAPNTWVEIKGANFGPVENPRIWQDSDFVNSRMPVQLDGVSATVNGKSAYVYYLSPSQVNILTPPDAMSGPVQVQVTANGLSSATFTAQAQALSPSFFVYGAGPYVAATNTDGGYVGPAKLIPGVTAPVKPGQTIMVYANGFGPTSVPVVSGALAQSGTLSPLPAVRIGGILATVQFAGLAAPGEFQFNVVVPPNVADGDQPIVALYGGASTQTGVLLTVQR